MSRLSLVATLCLVPALASAAPSTTIDLPTNGAFVDLWWQASGYAQGVGPSQELTVNGVVPTFTPILDTDLDGVLDAGPWSIDMTTLPPGLGQSRSAMHTLRVEIVDHTIPVLPVLVAADQVAYYDVPEFAADVLPQDYVHHRGVQLRVTDGGLADVADIVTREADAMVSTHLQPLFDGVDGDGDEIDVTLPVEICASLETLGIDLDVLSIGAVDFGVSVSDLSTVGLDVIELCVAGIHGDAWVDGSGLVSERPDHDLDGVPDDFLVLDAVTDAVEGTLTLGPIAVGTDLDARMSVSIAAASWLSPSVEVVHFEWPCDASVVLPSARAHLGLDLDGTGTEKLTVTQTTPFDLDLASPDAELSGVCAPLESLVDLVADAALGLAVEAVECAIDDPLCGGPLIPDLVEEALADVKLAGTVPIGETATLEVEAVIETVSEDETGVTVKLDTKVERGELDPFFVMVPGQPEAYAQPRSGAWFEAGDHYDASVYAEAALLSQLLHATFRTGAMHRQIALAEDLSVFDHTSSAAPTAPVTPELLQGLVTGLGQVMPAGTELVLNLGPRIAPVVVVEDGPQGYQLMLSAFQVELEVVEVATGTVWMTAVANLKAELVLEQDAAGALTVAFADPVVTFGLIGSAPIVALGDIGPGPGLSGAIEGWLTTTLASTIVAMPVPTLAVPSTSSAGTVVTVETHDTRTLPSGEEVRATITVD